MRRDRQKKLQEEVKEYEETEDERATTGVAQSGITTNPIHS
jgi:hypothetical protein